MLKEFFEPAVVVTVVVALIGGAIGLFRTFIYHKCDVPPVTSDADQRSETLLQFLDRGVAGNYAHLLGATLGYLDELFSGKARGMNTPPTARFLLFGDKSSATTLQPFLIAYGIASWYTLATLLYSFAYHESFRGFTSVEISMRFDAALPRILIMAFFAGWPLAFFWIRAIVLENPCLRPAGGSAAATDRYANLFGIAIAMVPAIAAISLISVELAWEFLIAGFATWLAVLFFVSLLWKGELFRALSATSLGVLTVAAIGSLVSYFFLDIQYQIVFILFYLSLPLVNAVLDWLSWGATRFFMSKLLENAHRSSKPVTTASLDVFLVVVDLLVGVVLLLLTILGFATFLGWFGRTFPETGIQSADFLSWSVASPLSAGLPFWTMAVSTLLPTLLHVFLAFLAFLLTPMRMAKHRVSPLLRAGKKLTEDEKLRIVNRFTLAAILSVVLSIVALVVFVYIASFVWGSWMEALVLKTMECDDGVLTCVGYLLSGP